MNICIKDKIKDNTSAYNKTAPKLITNSLWRRIEDEKVKIEYVLEYLKNFYLEVRVHKDKEFERPDFSRCKIL